MPGGLTKHWGVWTICTKQVNHLGIRELLLTNQTNRVLQSSGQVDLTIELPKQNSGRSIVLSQQFECVRNWSDDWWRRRGAGRNTRTR